MFLSRSLSYLLPSIACLSLFCNLAEAQTSFSLFSTEEELSDSDSILDDGSFYDTYTFDGAANQSVTIYLRSSDFDTYLILIDPNGNVIVENDDSNGASDSLIEAVLPMDGIYSVLVNSYGSESTGYYSLESDIFMSLESGGSISPQPQSSGIDELREVALSSFNAGDYRSAADSYSQVIQTGSSSSTLCDYFMQGNAEYLLENYEEAVRVYSEALRYYEKEVQIYSGVISNDAEGTILTGRSDQCGENLRIGHLGPELNFNAGNAYLRLGNYQQAIAQYDEALELQWQFADALYNRAMVKVLLGRVEEASSDFELLVQIYDLSYELYDGYNPDESASVFAELDSSNLDGDIFSIITRARWLGVGPQGQPSHGAGYRTAMQAYDEGCQAARLGNYALARARLEAAKNSLLVLGKRRESNDAATALRSNPIVCPQRR